MPFTYLFKFLLRNIAKIYQTELLLWTIEWMSFYTLSTQDNAWELPLIGMGVSQHSETYPLF